MFNDPVFNIPFGHVVQAIKDLFTKLSAKLDALSHLGLAAKPVITELEVKVDAPAIAMEEAAPVMMSTASLKAPEEAVAQVLSSDLDLF